MEKPILFTTDMVRAILEGRKTQTRRVIKPQPTRPYWCGIGHGWDDGHGYELKCPYGPIGTTLWVRETWCKNENPKSSNYGKHEYYADYDGAMCQELIKWRPSIHMPRDAARLFLTVIDRRVERVQDISIEDIVHEGIDCNYLLRQGICEREISIAKAGHELNYGLLDMINKALKREWVLLWNSINAKRGHGWDENDWVWAITFSVQEA